MAALSRLIHFLEKRLSKSSSSERKRRGHAFAAVLAMIKLGALLITKPKVENTRFVLQPPLNWFVGCPIASESIFFGGYGRPFPSNTAYLVPESTPLFLRRRLNRRMALRIPGFVTRYE